MIQLLKEQRMSALYRLLRPVFVSALLAALAIGAPSLSALQESDADRERTERVADILAALGVRDGLYVADVGSADGFYTLRIARAVAPTGRAYGVDIRADALDRLRQRMLREKVANFDTIHGEPNDPKLPAGELDAVLIRNSYHEMPEFRGVLAGIMRGLKTGGILVIVEPIHTERRHSPREEQVKEHEIAPELVEADLREAGFELLERRDPFVEFPKFRPGSFWLIRARRP